MIKITLKSHPTKRQMSCVLVNGELWREIAWNLVKNKMLEATYSSLNAWETTWNEWEKKQVKAAAYRKLGQRHYFKKELEAKLLLYGFSQYYIQEVLAELESLGYLNDSEGTDSLINKGVRAKKSPLWIAAQLKKKGVSIPNLEEFYPQRLREENILNLIKKSKKDKNKTIGSIARKGYSLEEILNVYRSSENTSM